MYLTNNVLYKIWYVKVKLVIRLNFFLSFKIILKLNNTQRLRKGNFKEYLKLRSNFLEVFANRSPSLNHYVYDCVCKWVDKNNIVIPVHVIESRAASIALLKLHKVVHGRMSGQGILVHEVLTADFTCEFHLSMMSFRMPFHIGSIHPHETALITGYGFWSMGLFHVSVQHELLRIRLVTSGTLEGSMDTMDDPQMCHQSGHEVKLFLAQIADFLVSLESGI